MMKKNVSYVYLTQYDILLCYCRKKYPNTYFLVDDISMFVK